MPTKPTLEPPPSLRMPSETRGSFAHILSEPELEQCVLFGVDGPPPKDTFELPSGASYWMDALPLIGSARFDFWLHLRKSWFRIVMGDEMLLFVDLGTYGPCVLSALSQDRRHYIDVLNLPTRVPALAHYTLELDDLGPDATATGMTIFCDGRVIMRRGLKNLRGSKTWDGLIQFVLGGHVSPIRYEATKQVDATSPPEPFDGVLDRGSFKLASDAYEWTAHNTDVAGLSSPLAIVEELCISSFTGRHMPGPVVQSISLAPGETTTISVSSYSKSNTESEEHRSVLDSTSRETTERFNDSVNEESRATDGSKSDFSSHTKVNASASWGWGSASVSEDLAFATGTNRERMTGRVTEAISENASTASNQRQVEVKTSSRHSYETGSETAVTRTISNINVSKPLDITFRQVVREVFAVLHVRDLKLSVVHDGERALYPLGAALDVLRDARGSQCSVLRQYLRRHPEARERLALQIVEYVDALDHKRDTYSPWTVAAATKEDVPPVEPMLRAGARALLSEALTADAEKTATGIREKTRAPNVVSYVDEDDAQTTRMRVRGTVLACTRHIMRTDALATEVELGDGGGLDQYSTYLQEAEGRLRKARAAVEEQRAELSQLLVAKARSGEADLPEVAKAFELVNQPSIGGKWELAPNGLRKAADT